MTSIKPITAHTAGESLTITFEISNIPTSVSLDSSMVRWYLVPTERHDNDNAVLSDDDAAVTVEVSGTTVTVAIADDTTTAFAGRRLHQRLEIDTADHRRRWGGSFHVQFA